MKIKSIQTSLFHAHANLPEFIVRHISSVAENTVLAVASKLFCLWKGDIFPYQNRKQKEELIVRESSFSLRTSLAWLSVKDGMVMTNAGIDESNADGKLLLLPKNCYKLAEQLRKELCQHWKVKNLGIVVTDSMILPLRAGVIAGAVAYAGFKGVKDLRGKPDLFGKKLQVTLVNVADTLASAAALEMGEGNEARPLALITEAPIEFVDRVPENEIKYPMKDDLYAPLFQAAGYEEKGDNEL